jgi:signal transduction histidine kinase
VAHEIRNPLMAIGGFAQRLLKKGEDQVNVSQYAELIARESQRLEGVLKDLMTYSAPYQPVLSSQDVVALLAKILSGRQEGFNSRQLLVKTAFEVRNLFIPMDGEALQRSLEQFLEIAAGLSEKGDRTLRVSLDLLPSISRVRIGLKFLGTPLPEEIKEVLHGRDFSSRAFGQNIPLSLCRKIIESHQGCLESEWEKGENRIWILLPLPAPNLRL